MALLPPTVVPAGTYAGLLFDSGLGSDVELRRPGRGVVVELLKMRSGEWVGRERIHRRYTRRGRMFG
jgi:hypothetical protein